MSVFEVNGHLPLSSRVEAAVRAACANLVKSTGLETVGPRMQVGLSELRKGRYGQIESSEEGLRLGTLVRMGQAEEHAVVRARYPVIRDTLALTSSKQIRNMATVGGNLLQRTRCESRSESYIATYSGDFAQALIALDATVDTIGADRGPRRIRFAELLHRRADDHPHIETGLQPGELITFINVPAGPWTWRSRYLKTLERQSYHGILASAAVALHMEGAKVRQARVALGDVASIPWRSHEAEAILKGRTLDEGLAARAAEAAFAKDRSREHNASRITLGKRILIRALLEAGAIQD
ncbi:MAG TPA: FAD binding domain-containing protein [Steroidobacteraceae bacterium]